MRLAIVGGRDFNDYERLKHLLSNAVNKVDCVICGEARGADALGKRWAIEHNIPVESYPADWNNHGKSAGFKRNVEMADRATHVLAFWDGHSKGTGHMIDICRRKPSLNLIIKRY